jgi:hypothetical protein
LFGLSGKLAMPGLWEKSQCEEGCLGKKERCEGSGSRENEDSFVVVVLILFCLIFSRGLIYSNLISI